MKLAFIYSTSDFAYSINFRVYSYYSW